MFLEGVKITYLTFLNVTLELETVYFSIRSTCETRSF